MNRLRIGLSDGELKKFSWLQDIPTIVEKYFFFKNSRSLKYFLYIIVGSLFGL